MMSSQFSEDGKYFAQIATDGKIKIWETVTSTFQQEFTPNLHLTAPCTCLHWIQGKTQTPWKKRKRRQSGTSPEDSTPLLVLGTSTGALLLYSVASAQVETTINSHTNSAVSCLTWGDAQDVYAGSDQYVLLFDFKDKRVKSKWKGCVDKITAILLVPNKPRLLTASRTIQLWDTSTRDCIKTFTGHSSNVSFLHFIPSGKQDSYFVSGSTSDRLLSIWSLNENSVGNGAVATLLMEDVANSVTICEGADYATNLAAVTKSGVMHVYQHTLNGQCAKPIKPTATLQVASDTGQSKDVVTPIPIISAYFHGDTSIMIAHGTTLFLTFENMVPNSYEKMQCLIRKDPRQTMIAQTKTEVLTKIKQPVVDKNVEYQTPYTSINLKQSKRKTGAASAEVPLKQRLENLTFNKLESGVPKQDNLAQLLVQGLHSKDNAILESVLCKRDETVVKNTIKRLPMQVIMPLLVELTSLIQGKTLAAQTGVLWLRYLIQIHASQLLANPELVEMVAPILGSIESRLSLLTPLSRLRGRLDLLVSQISDSASNEAQVDDALLLYKDQGSSDSESDENIEILNLHSDSENEWVEEEDTENSNEEDGVKVEENNVSESDMSM